ncbi:hemin uptake protein HemP [Paucibacter sp. KCTC 42545]|uniref:hemin uptake protein HemP n=1 Tax=Paucibacter sp. KCTC 42545 TaxID=1768242 RepID=UPI0009E69A0F|nr:hemin uptake protein HemP [Paucibacter sp. KCTC 42545]
MQASSPPIANGQPSAPNAAQAQPAPAVQHPATASTRRISSSELMGNLRELEIEHSGSLYRLRLTSLGKLILTK